MTAADTYWQQIATQLQELETEPLSAERVEDWVRRSDDVLKALDERYTHLKRAKYLHIQDTTADQAFNRFWDRMQAVQQTARTMLGARLLRLPDFTPPPNYTQLIASFLNDAHVYECHRDSPFPAPKSP
jgi:hypothetical protein